MARPWKAGQDIMPGGKTGRASMTAAIFRTCAGSVIVTG